MKVKSVIVPIFFLSCTIVTMEQPKEDEPNKKKSVIRVTKEEWQALEKTIEQIEQGFESLKQCIAPQTDTKQSDKNNEG